MSIISDSINIFIKILFKIAEGVPLNDILIVEELKYYGIILLFISVIVFII